jgi:serine/threonine protein kinase
MERDTPLFTSASRLEPGASLGGHYRVERLLGEGGMGVVYAARDERLGRSVAIKMLVADSQDPTARERLWREARAAASVNHPNICQIYAVDELDGKLYLVMELLDGQPLAERIAAGPLPPPDAMPIALAILAALGALHRRGITHRDLKPSNVFLTSDGVKLLDFGLAHPGETDTTNVRLTKTGIVLGTPRYMAPEQWTGRSVDARADLFSAGMLLFEMIAGKPPFGGATPAEIHHIVMNDQPPALFGSPAVLAADRVIHRALAKVPADRYPSAEAMADDLRTALALVDAGEPVRVRVVTRLIVLPFRLARQDDEIAFLATSLPEVITASLSSLESLIVRSSASALALARDPLDLGRLAREADVDTVLTGTLFRAGDQVRVSTQLVEVPAGTVVRSHTAQASMGDLFQLQDLLARDTVESLALPLSRREQRMLASDVPASATSYELYLRANQGRSSRQPGRSRAICISSA